MIPAPQTTPRIETIAELITQAQRGTYGPEPSTLHITSAFWIRHSTQFSATAQKYHNYYLLLRVGQAFGACAIEPDQVDPEIATMASGQPLAVLLDDPCLALRIAALDAYFGAVLPHREAPQAQPVILPAGTPLTKARYRDETIARLLKIQPGDQIGLIGVVNPLVKVIREQGGVCLPCDFNLRTTEYGDQVTADMEHVLDRADAVIATGMTLGNGTFERIMRRVRERAIPLVIYAQTGSAIVPRFLAQGVTAISAEPFPFSQFSSDPTTIFCYRLPDTHSNESITL